MSLTRLSKMSDKPREHRVAITKDAYISLVKIIAWFKGNFGFAINGEQAFRFAMNLYDMPTEELMLLAGRMMKTRRVERIQGMIKVNKITHDKFKLFQTKLMGSLKHSEYVATALLMNAAEALPEAKWKSTSGSTSHRQKYPVPLRAKTM